MFVDPTLIHDVDADSRRRSNLGLLLAWRVAA